MIGLGGKEGYWGLVGSCLSYFCLMSSVLKGGRDLPTGPQGAPRTRSGRLGGGKEASWTTRAGVEFSRYRIARIPRAKSLAYRSRLLRCSVVSPSWRPLDRSCLVFQSSQVCEVEKFSAVGLHARPISFRRRGYVGERDFLCAVPGLMQLDGAVESRHCSLRHQDRGSYLSPGRMVPTSCMACTSYYGHLP